MVGESQLQGEITQFLTEYNLGNSEAFENLINLVYEELRDMAKRHLPWNGRSQHSLPPTGLVHEVYIRLRRQKSMVFENRKQFFWFIGRLMRQVLADRARHKSRQKRGGQADVLPLEDVRALMAGPDLDPSTWIAFDEALTRLWDLDQRQYHIVEMRFFAGLEIREISELMDISPTTIKRDWHAAKLWLAGEVFGKRVSLEMR